MTPAPTTAPSTAAGTAMSAAAAAPTLPAPASGGGKGGGAGDPLPIDPMRGDPACIKNLHSLRVEILAAGDGRDLQSLRRYEPGQVQRISALPTGQRFLSPLSGISLERASFNAAAQAGSRGCGPRRAKCCTTAEA